MDKAYIVADKEQELDVLKKFEQKGLVWANGETPTDWITSETDLFNYFASFPYALLDGDVVSWRNMNELDGIEIVYDGRKEEKMYKVTQEFMNELIKWRDTEFLDATTGSPFHFLSKDDLDNLNNDAKTWWYNTDNPIERNNRLIAIIQWLNGEDVFEVDEPHKFVVRNNTTDSEGYYYYVRKVYTTTDMVFSLEGATRFDTREEAQEWANSHQVVVEIDADGNEVE